MVRKDTEAKRSPRFCKSKKAVKGVKTKTFDFKLLMFKSFNLRYVDRNESVDLTRHDFQFESLFETFEK